MKFLALALDYDGTIAENDTRPGVREAIAYVRSKGIVVLLVTGRILSYLRKVAGDLHFVDAVVAENGAVLEFTDSGYSRQLGNSPPLELLGELDRRGIRVSVGSVSWKPKRLTLRHCSTTPDSSQMKMNIGGGL